MSGASMSAMILNIKPIIWWSFLAGFMLLFLSIPLHAEERSAENNSQVMQAFTPKDDGESSVIPVEDKTKKVVMFVMGVPLLIFLLVTGALGIAMGVYGKQVFVAHMIFAGLSMTLALAHAIVGLVWFYPY
jgi:hypothetical protein